MQISKIILDFRIHSSKFIQIKHEIPIFRYFTGFSKKMLGNPTSDSERSSKILYLHSSLGGLFDTRADREHMI